MPFCIALLKIGVGIVNFLLYNVKNYLFGRKKLEFI